MFASIYHAPDGTFVAHEYHCALEVDHEGDCDFTRHLTKTIPPSHYLHEGEVPPWMEPVDIESYQQGTMITERFYRIVDGAKEWTGEPEWVEEG